MKFRGTPEARGKVQRAYGRCFACFGKGERTGITGRLQPCSECNGSGRLTEYSICMFAMAAGITVCKTIEALLDLEEQGIASRRDDGGVELWRIVSATPDSSHCQVSSQQMSR